MTEILRSQTAKIYQFPRKAPLASGEQTGSGKDGGEPRAKHVSQIDFGSSWYHEAAIQEADRFRKP